MRGQCDRQHRAVRPWQEFEFYLERARDKLEVSELSGSVEVRRPVKRHCKSLKQDWQA